MGILVERIHLVAMAIVTWILKFDAITNWNKFCIQTDSKIIFS